MAYDKDAIKAAAAMLDECSLLVTPTKEQRGATRKQCWTLASLLLERNEDVERFRGHPLSSRDASEAIGSRLQQKKH